MVRVQVEVRAGGERASHVIERAHRDARGVDELDVAHGVRRVAKVWAQLDGAPRTGLLVAELQRVGVLGAQAGVAAEDIACVLSEFDGAELKRVRPAHAARVADLCLARGRGLHHHKPRPGRFKPLAAQHRLGVPLLDSQHRSVLMRLRRDRAAADYKCMKTNN